MSMMDVIVRPIVRECFGSNFNSIHIYSCSAFHNTHHFKAALQKMHESMLQFRVICYQTLSKLCVLEMYYIYKITVSEKCINLNNVIYGQNNEPVEVMKHETIKCLNS